MAEGPIRPTGPERPATELVEAADILRPSLREPGDAVPLAKRLMGTFVYRGPIPPPSMMADYDKIVPGGAAMILQMAQAEQKHRHRMEARETAYPFLGMAAGITALAICTIAATVLAMHDKTIIAGMLLGVPMLGTIGWFVQARLNAAAEAPPTD